MRLLDAYESPPSVSMFTDMAAMCIRQARSVVLPKESVQ